MPHGRKKAVRNNKQRLRDESLAAPLLLLQLLGAKNYGIIFLSFFPGLLRKMTLYSVFGHHRRRGFSFFFLLANLFAEEKEK